MKTTQLKERPILFSGPMVQAILSGRKTQTRRVLKPQPEPCEGDRYRWAPPGARYDAGLGMWIPLTTWRADVEVMRSGAAGIAEFCPYGTVGDRLWVRETFAPRLDVDPREEPLKARDYALYRADGSSLDEPHWHHYPDRWTPSIFMPRWACRIVLEITDVRVERLHRISQDDAAAEGFPWLDDPMELPPKGRFRETWQALNGEASWDADPWVWAVTFSRIGGE
ncbi:hypothetical protein [Paludisphaera sp.]|uniref:hypothetical protein n=1 Tax=Paludisphaera sp. TaxID=2017432 RepID=UPI00301C3268